MAGAIPHHTHDVVVEIVAPAADTDLRPEVGVVDRGKRRPPFTPEGAPPDLIPAESPPPADVLFRVEEPLPVGVTPTSLELVATAARKEQSRLWREAHPS